MARTKQKRRGLRGLIIGVMVIVVGLLWFHWQCWGMRTNYTKVELSALPAGFDGLRIVHLSDLHGHQYGENSAVLLAAVEREAPDLIVITGDLIDRSSQLSMIPSLAEGLCAIAPTYYVTGNHEWAAKCARELKTLLTECGVTVLTNQYEVLERNGDRIVLAGVDDPNGLLGQKTPEEVAKEIETHAPGLFTVLLAHRNDRFGQYAAAGFDLVLSGHAHGGIVRLPFTDGLLGNSRNFFPTWTAGVYRLEGSTLFVSRGLGNNTTPMPGFRLFNRPDLAVLTLQTAP